MHYDIEFETELQDCKTVTVVAESCAVWEGCEFFELIGEVSFRVFFKETPNSPENEIDIAKLTASELQAIATESETRLIEKIGSDETCGVDIDFIYDSMRD